MIKWDIKSNEMRYVDQIIIHISYYFHFGLVIFFFSLFLDCLCGWELGYVPWRLEWSSHDQPSHLISQLTISSHLIINHLTINHQSSHHLIISHRSHLISQAGKREGWLYDSWGPWWQSCQFEERIELPLYEFTWKSLKHPRFLLYYLTISHLIILSTMSHSSI